MGWKEKFNAGLSKLFASGQTPQEPDKPAAVAPPEKLAVPARQGEQWQPTEDGVMRVRTEGESRVTERFNFHAQQCITITHNPDTGVNSVSVAAFKDVDAGTRDLATAFHRGDIVFTPLPQAPDQRRIAADMAEKGMVTDAPVTVGPPLRLRLSLAVLS